MRWCFVPAMLVFCGCAETRLPAPDGVLAAYADAAKKGDEKALAALLTDDSRRNLGADGVARAVQDAKVELAAQADAVRASKTPLEATARVRFDDGEEATLVLENGAFHVTSADALPSAAKSPAQALEQLRRVLARRSYAGLMRVLSKETRAAMERDLRALVDGLERPEGLDVHVQGDSATVILSGGHLVRMHREGDTWHVEDFD